MAKQEDVLLQEMERIVAYQFDGATNLTQEGYEDSIKMIGEQILAKVKEKYVPWDSGKVSNWLSQNFEAITDADADQLHKLLTGEVI